MYGVVCGRGEGRGGRMKREGRDRARGVEGGDESSQPATFGPNTVVAKQAAPLTDVFTKFCV